MTHTYADSELIDFIVGMNPQATLAYSPTETTRGRVRNLVEREKTADLTPDERTELNHYIQPEHIMTLAKAKAPLRLDHA